MRSDNIFEQINQHVQNAKNLRQKLMTEALLFEMGYELDPADREEYNNVLIANVFGVLTQSSTEPLTDHGLVHAIQQFVEAQDYYPNSSAMELADLLLPLVRERLGPKKDRCSEEEVYTLSNLALSFIYITTSDESFFLMANELEQKEDNSPINERYAGKYRKASILYEKFGDFEAAGRTSEKEAKCLENELSLLKDTSQNSNPLQTALIEFYSSWDNQKRRSVSARLRAVDMYLKADCLEDAARSVDNIMDYWKDILISADKLILPKDGEEGITFLKEFGKPSLLGYLHARLGDFKSAVSILGNASYPTSGGRVYALEDMACSVAGFGSSIGYR